MQMFGVLLISALMIVPIAASILIGKSFKNTIVIAIVFSEISIIFGIYFSYIFALPSGSIIVILNIIILTFVMFIDNILKRQKKNKKNNNIENENPLIKENIVLETETSLTLSTKDIEVINGNNNNNNINNDIK